ETTKDLKLNRLLILRSFAALRMTVFLDVVRALQRTSVLIRPPRIRSEPPSPRFAGRRISRVPLPLAGEGAAKRRVRAHSKRLTARERNQQAPTPQRIAIERVREIDSQQILRCS